MSEKKPQMTAYEQEALRELRAIREEAETTREAVVWMKDFLHRWAVGGALLFLLGLVGALYVSVA